MAKAPQNNNPPANPPVHVAPGTKQADAIKDAANAVNNPMPNPQGAENAPQFDRTNQIDRSKETEGGGVVNEATASVKTPENSNPPANTSGVRVKPNGLRATTAKPGTPEFNADVRRQQEKDAPEKFLANFNFDLVELAELYANVRDGNYWSAFKMAITILNKNVNPVPLTRGSKALALTPVRDAEVEDICEKLEDCCENLQRNQLRHTELGMKGAVGTSQEKNVGMIDPAMLFTLIQFIIDLIKKRKQQG